MAEVKKPKSLDQECAEAANDITQALLNSFVFPPKISSAVADWLKQRITLVMVHQHYRRKPREEEAYHAGYEQGYNDARASKEFNATFNS